MPQTSPDRNSTSSPPNVTFKFPSIQPDGDNENAISDNHSERDPSPIPPANRASRDTQWQPRKKASSIYSSGSPFGGQRRTRQKSLSEAFRTIHNRRASVSENAHEIAEALKAPVSLKLILLCGFWYMTSIFSNASSKAILIAFRKPVTLTVVQFAFVSCWCIISSYLAHLYPSLRTMVPALKYNIRPPSRELIITTLPLTVFQIGGHILNSDAMSRIPVSLVHTIKGLSPLFTVMAYRLVFRIHYSLATYLSLIPLTLGVVMACSANLSANMIGLLGAFGSALLFVTQNIVSKRLFNEAARAESEGLQQLLGARKPDKLNLLCYSSGLAFIFTLPIWLWSEVPGILHDLFAQGALKLSDRPDALDHGRLTLEFIFNGTFHFAQSLVAFVLLSMVSPVTYSVASLIKRVFVIVFAIIWFGNPMTRIQGAGIALTFLGLYLYDRTNDAARADRRAKLQQTRSETPLLPLISEGKKVDLPARVPTPLETGGGNAQPFNAPAFTMSPEDMKSTPSPFKKTNGGDGAGLLRPGTKQEETWVAKTPPQPNGTAA